MAGGSCQNATTRLNVINSAGFAWFQFAVDGHHMRVVALDAQPTVPSELVKVIDLNAGQRVSVELCPDNGTDTSAGNTYWVRAFMEQSVFAQDSPDPLVLAILEYNEQGGNTLTVSNANTTLPKTDAGAVTSGSDLQNDFPFDPYELESLSIHNVVGQKAPEPTRIIPMQIQFYADPAANGTNRPHFAVGNQPNVSYEIKHDGAMTASLLETIYDGKLPPNENMGHDTITLLPGDIVELRIDNYDGGEHPLHLHGHWMYVMARGKQDDGPYHEGIAYDQTPVLRDTVSVEANSYIVVRFVANNPGVFIMHCHIDWHLFLGLMLAFQYGLGVDVSPAFIQ